jgi:16S rRNA (uracil1498-N3)-methyltransferase
VSLSGARLIVGTLPAAGETARLTAEESLHARARRLRRGDAVVLVDGTGREAAAVLTRLEARSGEALVQRVLSAGERASRVALLVCGLRAERLAWLAQKATELEAESLTLVASSRTQSFRASAGAIERLERVCREAAKQSEAARWPKIAGPLPLDRVLALGRASHRLFLDASGEAFPAALPPRPLLLLVGPEGGWNEEEREAARAREWSVVALPAGKLRAETAAIAAVVLARAALARGLSEAVE